MFAELGAVNMPIIVGEALAKRKAHVDRSRAMGMTAEECYASWRTETTTAKWSWRRQQRAEKHAKLMAYARRRVAG